ncbi:MAG TPA: carboxymuconolactone decarboxylase family protein [Mycobacteriales bacterium]|nr:carboxymuconolactone decarboxylase family protein [Mycobacteriales bacterium]
MPIIEPIPLEELSPRAREIIEGGYADGLYATTLPLQVFAYNSERLEATHAKRLAIGAGTLLGGRILELLRIRSAQLGECQPCMQSRKHESITDGDVTACLVTEDRSGMDPQERMALEFLDLLSADHHALDADFYRSLSEVFTTAQIVELGFACTEMMGTHRFVHTLDIFGSEPPTLRYSPDQVDTRHEASAPLTAPA